ncbi:Fic family protein [Trinickia sp. NRRL B-1857]|uniref:Fic family protein n=1 Tax=Trinickia sp. NRRL B-1857 TaxID=3162879 RepID=UPI003D2CCF98
MANHSLLKSILEYIAGVQGDTSPGVQAGAIAAYISSPRPNVNRALAHLIAIGAIERQGAGRSVTYRVPEKAPLPVDVTAVPHEAATAYVSPPWSTVGRNLITALSAPLGARHRVSYHRSYVDQYQPNVSSLLPAALGAQLYEIGKSKDQQPAGTYARKLREILLIDLSWYSSRLEGNRKSLSDTQALFERGCLESDDRDAIMLLNHKEAIEFLIDAVPSEGISVLVVRNLQSVLLRDLLLDAADLGAIRKKVVNIQDTVYVPSQLPSLLEETLEKIIEKARLIRNPVEAAFFLWVNLAYLQPFVDGNKRTSRLAANMPLMLANCSPLSFIDVGQSDYALAMIGVYERLDTTLAVELFEWTYRRSVAKYHAVVEAMGEPDALRANHGRPH